MIHTNLMSDHFVCACYCCGPFKSGSENNELNMQYEIHLKTTIAFQISLPDCGHHLYVYSGYVEKSNIPQGYSAQQHPQKGGQLYFWYHPTAKITGNREHDQQKQLPSRFHFMLQYGEQQGPGYQATQGNGQVAYYNWTVAAWCVK